MDETAATVERATDVDADGWVYDVETGEVLGHRDADEAFRVDSVEAANYVLGLRSEIEGELAGLAARKAGLVRQLDALIAAGRRRLSYWDYRFAGELEVFARGLLEGGRSRTAQFTWGRVSFRRTPGRSTIVSMEEAVEFVRAWAPDQVEVRESVTLKAIDAARTVAEHDTGEIVSTPFVTVTGPGETVVISTGVDVEAVR